MINNLRNLPASINAQFRGVNEKDFKDYFSIGEFVVNHQGEGVWFVTNGIVPKNLGEWRLLFEKNDIAFQINILRHLLEINSELSELHFNDYVGSEFAISFHKNIQLVKSYIGNWFFSDMRGKIRNAFIGLDFCNDGIDDDIKEFIYDEEGDEKELIFNDGSHFKFNNKEIRYKNVFVLSAEFNELFSGLTNIKESLGILSQNEKQNK